MKKKIIVLAVAIIVVIIAVVAVRGNSKDEKQVLKIGLIGPFSGDYATVGETFRNGAQLAVEDIKAKNPNRKVELFVEDDAFNSGKALSAYKKLRSFNHIDALIAVDSMAIDSVYDDAVKDGIPVINGGEQSLDPVKDNIIQINPGNYNSEVAIGKAIKDDGKKNLALITGNHPVFLRFSKGLKVGYGGNVNESIVNFDEKDIRTIAVKIKAQNPDSIAMLITPDLIGKFVKTFNDLGVKNVSYYFDSDLQNGWDTTAKIISPNLLNGSKVALINNVNKPEFVEEYNKRFGNNNILLGNVGYDTVNIIADNYNSDNSKWVNGILNSNIDGVSGNIKFDSVGVREPSFQIKAIENGTLPQ